MDELPEKSILHKTAFKNNQWFAIDYNINLYKGCNYGCIYCDSRSSCYGIENFDQVCVKHNTLTLLGN